MNIEIQVISSDIADKLEKASAKAQFYYALRVLAYSDKYTPFKTGTLKNTAVAGKDYILYTQPYARMHWFGKKMVDPVTHAAGFLTDDGWRSRKGVQKVLTDQDLKYSGAPMRGPFWVERMWIDKREVITREIGTYLAGEFDE